MNIGAIIQARMSSNRFSGKVLYRVNGKPMLQYLLERIEHCSSLDGIVVATSTEESDTPIAEFCKEFGIACYRGALFDVAGRFKDVLDKYQFDGFVRVTGDSPLLDYRLIDKGVRIFRQSSFEIVTNILRRTYPAGQSIEIFNACTFMEGYKLMEDPRDLEHVTIFFYRNHQNYKILNLVAPKDHSRMQLSVDTPQDMAMFEAIVAHMKRDHWKYGVGDILKIYGDIISSEAKV